MPSFQYKAVNQTGQQTRGRLDATNDVDLELRLRRMGLDLITFRQIRTGAATGGGKVDRKELINFCFDMEQMARAGIPMLEGLRDLRDSLDNARFKSVVSSMLEDIEGGKMLSQAMVAFPQIFDNVFVSLVRAGEQTGRLIDVFKSMSESLKWQDELAAQTKKLLIYPMLVLVVVLGVLAFLLVYLVPQVVGLLKTMRIDLPLQTRILIALSDFVVNYWWVVIAVPVLAVIGVVALIRANPQAAFVYDRLKLRVPVIGPILQKIILSRFANFFAMMYQSNITVLDAIRTSEGIVGNRVIASGLRQAGQQINAGEPLSDTFQKLGIFPPLVIRMLWVGENTGALDTALLNISYFYNRDVRDSVDKALKLIEPALTLVLGTMLALILFSVLTPIYDMIGQIRI
ncbi:MAG: type II secretion system F family protein [Burkholderiales bacterium]|nr:type II secretion system F family protein [Burkholderiales bacterium]